MAYDWTQRGVKEITNLFCMERQPLRAIWQASP